MGELLPAFESTLQEVKGADLVLHVSDATDRFAARKRAVVHEALANMLPEVASPAGIDSSKTCAPPILEVWNKLDAGEVQVPDEVWGVSALDGRGVTALLRQIETVLL